MRTKRTFAVYVTTVILVALLLVSPAGAQAETIEPPTIPSLIDALRLVSTTVGAGMVISFLFTRVDWFKALTGDRRFWVVFGLCMTIPLAATLALNLVPVADLVRLEPVWNAIATGFTVFIGSQIQYALTTNRSS